jgi:predicted alpha/beta superfamily hydrolase
VTSAARMGSRRRRGWSSSHTLTGDIRLHTRFRSAHLGTSRDVQVYLPPGYESHPSRRHPVLYVHDGQNVFDGATAFIPGEEWQLDESAERLIASGEVEPLIIVAVDHGAERRLDEFAPSRDSRRRAGGHAGSYGRMLVEEVKPFIDRVYRTRPGPEDTGLCGSSMGGLVTLYLGLIHPTVFTRLAVMSPAAWWDRRAIVRQVERLEGRLPLRIWLDMGGEEGRHAIRDVRALRDALVAKGWRVGRDLHYREVEGGRHTEADWAARVPDVLRFLFPPNR